MRASVFLKFENTDVSGRASKITLQIDSEFCECIVEIANRITLNLRRIEGQSHKTRQSALFRNRSYSAFVFFCLARRAIAAVPAFTIDSIKLGAGRFKVLTPHCEPSAMFSASGSVSINLYWVKERREGCFAARGALPHTPPAFRLKWRASPRLSTG